jgi:hypothetical protein
VLGNTLEFGHRKLVKQTDMKHMKISSSDKSSADFSLFAKKLTFGIEETWKCDNRNSRPASQSGTSSMPPIGRSRML